MRTKNREKHQIQPWEMSHMESRLEAVLQGVNPRPDFVSTLRTRLNKEPEPDRSNARIFQYVIITLAGLLSAVLLVLAGVKAIVALLSVLGVLHQASRGRSDSVQPAA
jgi:hypothetical protein